MSKLLSVSAIVAMSLLPPALSVLAQAAPSPRNLKASEFQNIWGANIHFGDNSYRNIQAVADALNIIGFSRVRSSCTGDAEVASWKELAAKSAVYFPGGLKANVLVIGYLNAPNVTFESQQKLIPQILPLIESIEGPNEINNYAVGNGTHGPFDLSDQTTHFAANSLAWAKTLSDWKKRVPALSKVLLTAPDIASGDPKEYAQLPNVSPYANFGNIHFYAGNGRPPSGFGGGNFAAIYQWYQAADNAGQEPCCDGVGTDNRRQTGSGRL